MGWDHQVLHIKRLWREAEKRRKELGFMLISGSWTCRFLSVFSWNKVNQQQTGDAIAKPGAKTKLFWLKRSSRGQRDDGRQQEDRVCPVQTQLKHFFQVIFLSLAYCWPHAFPGRHWTHINRYNTVVKSRQCNACNGKIQTYLTQKPCKLSDIKLSALSKATQASFSQPSIVRVLAKSFKAAKAPSMFALPRMSSIIFLHCFWMKIIHTQKNFKTINCFFFFYFYW